MPLNKTRFVIFSALLLAAPLSCQPTGTAVKKELERSAAMEGQSADMRYRMGMAHLMDRKIGEALTELTAAVEMEPENPTYQDALGQAYFARRINDKAIVHFKRSVAIDENHSEAWLHLGAVYMDQGMWDEAINASGMVLKNVFFSAPEYAYNNIGWALFNKNDYINAILNFRKAVELNQRYPMPYYNMGISYERLNRPERAIESYDAAIKADKTFAAPHFNKGRIYMQRGEHGAAAKAFGMVVELDPSGDMGKAAKEYMEVLR